MIKMKLINIYVFVQEKGYVIVEYNLGTESIIIADKATTFNDGEYHVARYKMPRFIH